MLAVGLAKLLGFGPDMGVAGKQVGKLAGG